MRSCGRCAARCGGTTSRRARDPGAGPAPGWALRPGLPARTPALARLQVAVQGARSWPARPPPGLSRQALWGPGHEPFPPSAATCAAARGRVGISARCSARAAPSPSPQPLACEPGDPSRRSPLSQEPRTIVTGELAAEGGGRRPPSAAKGHLQRAVEIRSKSWCAVLTLQNVGVGAGVGRGLPPRSPAPPPQRRGTDGTRIKRCFLPSVPSKFAT